MIRQPIGQQDQQLIASLRRTGTNSARGQRAEHQPSGSDQRDLDGRAGPPDVGPSPGDANQQG